MAKLKQIPIELMMPTTTTTKRKEAQRGRSPSLDHSWAAFHRRHPQNQALDHCYLTHSVGHLEDYIHNNIVIMTLRQVWRWALTRRRDLLHTDRCSLWDQNMA